jgi:hypothetical protein
LESDSNWAIFIEENQIKWTFGNPDDEFLSLITNFISGLSNIGEEILGQHGIASIEFDLKKHSEFRTAEVFIISLMNKFFLLMTDPIVTMKLIEASGGIAHEVKEIMSAVLVGQAAVLYAQCISEVSSEIQNVLESLWRGIILDISKEYMDDIDKILSSGGSNFSMMSFEDLIFLHYYLRQQPVLAQPLSPKGWALCSHMSGGEIPLTYQIVDQDPAVIAGYLAIIISFLVTIFDSKPKHLIFGTNSISKLTFINGEDYFLAIDGDFIQLATDPEFFEDFFAIKNEIRDDFREGLTTRIIEEILESQGCQLQHMSVQELLDHSKNQIIQKSTIPEDSAYKKSIHRTIGRL